MRTANPIGARSAPYLLYRPNEKPDASRAFCLLQTSQKS